MTSTSITATSGSAAPAGGLGDLATDLAAASLALARRFAAGATMWCCSPNWPHHARHIAVEFVHPVIVGKRALPALIVPGDDLVANLRVSVRSGDIVVAVADADDPAVAEAMQRARAWGVETLWIGVGPRPDGG
ncbi:MAG: hydrogenase assembly protein HupF, partial [Actinomycetota bacterium]|nr:hydrogenase assembly protein HupF [Actinomycetota bacterium]